MQVPAAFRSPLLHRMRKRPACLYELTVQQSVLLAAAAGGHGFAPTSLPNPPPQMRLQVSLLWAFVASMSTPATVSAYCHDNRPPKVNHTHALQEAMLASATGSRFEANAAITQGVCYSPFHNPEYPLTGGSAAGLDTAMANDFSIMSSYFSVVRTYYSSFYGYPVTPPAAANGIKLYLGVYMTDETWYSSQVDAAVTAVVDYPATVSAILVGNENISPAGSYSAATVSQRITDLRTQLATQTSATVPIGTVQRATEWLDSSKRTEMLALAANCDIIGVNIYPFFDSSYDATYPLVILNAVWEQMLSIYPASKLRLTEIGWPTAGSPSEYALNNIPSLANSKYFYDAYLNWNPSDGGNEAFWFMFFDRSPNDPTVVDELERHFGFYTWQKQSKAGDYPARLSALAAVAAASSTESPTVTPTPTPEPTTAAPTPVPTTVAPTPAPTPEPTTAAPTPVPTTAAPTPDPTAETPTTTPPTVTPVPTTATLTPAPTTATPTPVPTTAAPTQVSSTVLTVATPETTSPAMTASTPAPSSSTAAPTVAAATSCDI